MAVTVTQGTISTYGIDGTSGVQPAEQVVDMRNEFAELDPDDSQFVTLLTKLGNRQAVSQKINWLEDSLRPRLLTLAASATSAATTITLTSGYYAYVAPDDMIRNLTTGEMMYVSAVSANDVVTVTRAVGGVAAASSASTAQLKIVGSAYKQGASFGTSRVVQRVAGYNYTEIQRDPFSFTGTETAIEEYGGRNPMKEQVKQLIEHKKSIEGTLFWGARSFDTTNKRGTCGGAYEFISTNTNKSVGTLDKSTFDTNVMTALQHGNLNSKAFFVAPIVNKAMSGFLRDNWVRATPSETKWGVHVDAWVSGAYGVPIPIFIKRSWGIYSTSNVNGPGGAAFLLDMDYIRYAPLRDRDTQLLLKRQSPGDDVDSREYLTEFSLEFMQESCHAFWSGITA